MTFAPTGRKRLLLRTAVLVCLLSGLPGAPIGPGSRAMGAEPLPDQIPGLPSPYEQYLDAELGFSFFYPQGWELTEERRAAGSSNVQFGAPVGVGGRQTIIHLRLGALSIPLEEVMASRHVEIAPEPSAEWQETEWTTADGLGGKMYRSRIGVLEGIPNATGAMGVMVGGGGRLYQLSVSGSEEDLTAQEDLYLGVLESLRVWR